MRFPGAERHQLFLEPEGLDTTELYVNGLSTSLPTHVQLKMLRSVPGLERVRMTRAGYAIEYDYYPPTQLLPWLEVRTIGGLFFAGQINGTTGYEEAGAQGVMAGFNAALLAMGRAPVTLGRETSYIGVLIDDLVTRGTREPYRMFTSRAEHRLLLREDNTDVRLLGHGRRLGLVDDATWSLAERRRAAVEAELERLAATTLAPGADLEGLGSSPLRRPTTLLELLRRPEIDAAALARFGPAIEDPSVAERVEVVVKYEGYLRRQEVEAARLGRLEGVRLPDDLDYRSLGALSNEVREKLSAARPRSLGQAARLSGITPAAVSILATILAQRSGQKTRPAE